MAKKDRLIIVFDEEGFKCLMAGQIKEEFSTYQILAMREDNGNGIRIISEKDFEENKVVHTYPETRVATDVDFERMHFEFSKDDNPNKLWAFVDSVFELSHIKWRDRLRLSLSSQKYRNKESSIVTDWQIGNVILSLIISTICIIAASITDIGFNIVGALIASITPAILSWAMTYKLPHINETEITLTSFVVAVIPWLCTGLLFLVGLSE